MNRESSVAYGSCVNAKRLCCATGAIYGNTECAGQSSQSDRDGCSEQAPRGGAVSESTRKLQAEITAAQAEFTVGHLFLTNITPSNRPRSLAIQAEITAVQAEFTAAQAEQLRDYQLLIFISIRLTIRFGFGLAKFQLTEPTRQRFAYMEST
ncbi:hypothetical protein LSAT2_007553 [Lamellibrachia satsuma]|nr:hypothetical protein LSAT2_007553 [Lamellibrachia satsuma]